VKIGVQELARALARSQYTGSSSSSGALGRANGGPGPVESAVAPTFSPGSGTYASAQSITMNSTTPGAVVHYTVDGGTPTASSPTSQPVAVDTTTTIKAIAVTPNFLDSAIATGTYTIVASPDRQATATGFSSR